MATPTEALNTSIQAYKAAQAAAQAASIEIEAQAAQEAAAQAQGK